MKNLLIPKNFLALTLFILLVLSSFTFSAIDILVSAIVSIGTAVVVDLIITRSIFLPSAGVISGLIIALLFPSQTPLYIISFASVIAISGKHLGRKFFGESIFNPAAAGLFTASLIFNNPVSWWGVSWGAAPLILTAILVGYLVIFRMRRWAIPLSFLVIYFLILVIQSPSILISKYLNILFYPTIIFFSLVMLPEPTTSPNEQKRQVFYGIFVAIVVTILSSPIFNFQFSIFNSVDPLLLSLLLGNLVFKFL